MGIDRRAAILAWVLAVGGSAGSAAAANASAFAAACSGTTGDAGSLVAAINGANNAIGASTVALGPGCTYTLTAANNYWYGPNGLPAIANAITIQGNGATIARPSSAPKFRLFFVAADPRNANTNNYVSPSAIGGSLTLEDLTLSGGLAKGGDSNTGGGGAGLGGAIFSQGIVVIESSTLTANTAQGGSAINSSAGLSGGGIGTDSTFQGGGGFGPGTFAFGAGGGAGGGGSGGGAGFRVGETGGASSGVTGGNGGGPATGLGGNGGAATATGGAAGGTAGDGSGGGGASGYGALSGGSAGGGFGDGAAANFEATGDGGGGGVGGGGANRSGTDLGAGGGGFGGGGGMGGAIFNMQGQLTIQDSTLAGNEAEGGADSVSDPGKGYGGAVFNMSGSFAADDSTFANNTVAGRLATADDGASIYNLVYDDVTARTAQTTLRDTIVANGTGAVDLTNSKTGYISPGPNLGTAASDVSQFDLVRTDDVSGGSLTGSPLTADPLLGSLRNNGGPTETMAPAPGSPVIDAGSAFGLATDQRGRPRPFVFPALPQPGDGSDIGAFELQGPTISIAVPAANGAYTQGRPVSVVYTCAADTGVLLTACSGTLANGAALDTQTLGQHTLTVNAQDSDGATATASATYTVLAAPTVTITTPAASATYTQGQSVTAAYTCAAATGATVSACSGPVANGAAVDTQTLGQHTFTVNAQDSVGGTAAHSASYTVVPLPVPTLTDVSESAKTWREGGALAHITAAKRKRKPPVGTTFSFVLSEPATVTLNFTQPRAGRRVRRACVAQTHANHRKPRCTRTVIVGTLSFAARQGINRVHFAGRSSRTHRLPLGHYTLRITATNSQHERSKQHLLSFTIVT